MTFVVRYNSQMSIRRARRFVDSRDSKCDAGRLVDVDCRDRPRTYVDVGIDGDII